MSREHRTAEAEALQKGRELLITVLTNMATQLQAVLNALDSPGEEVRQEMYGQMQSPSVLQGRINITIELLSPSRQPLQLTQNLASFWQNAWQEVRKEMRGRYPKHYWPEDPAQAMPTTKTKKAMLK